jgi:hypothetical protein
MIDLTDHEDTLLITVPSALLARADEVIEYDPFCCAA